MQNTRKFEFVDLHSHILPFIDDGAEDEDISIEMLKIAYNDGIRHIIATPHFIPGELESIKATVRLRLSGLIEKIKNINLKINIYPGCEIFLSPDIPELLEKGMVCTLNNSSYVLIELPLMNIPPYTDELLYELQLKGYKPIIAHPERNNDIIVNPNILFDFVKRGILVQSNSNSFLGVHGRKVKETAFILLTHGMVHFISSDAHSIRTRAPRLQKTFKLITDKVGLENGLKLFYRNGIAVINNQDIEIPEPEQVKNKKSFLLTSLMKLVDIRF